MKYDYTRLRVIKSSVLKQIDVADVQELMTKYQKAGHDQTLNPSLSRVRQEVNGIWVDIFTDESGDIHAELSRTPF